MQKRNFNVRLDPNQLKRMEEFVEDSSILASKAELTRRAIRAYLDNNSGDSDG